MLLSYGWKQIPHKTFSVLTNVAHHQPSINTFITRIDITSGGGPRQTTANAPRFIWIRAGGDTPCLLRRYTTSTFRGFRLHSFASSAIQPQPPAIAIVEPVSVFDQQPRIMSMLEEAASLGFVVVDDTSQFSEVTITIES